MKRQSFKDYLQENAASFYQLYNTPFPSDAVKKMPPGEAKDAAIKIETIKYKMLMTDFLRNVGAMN